MVKSYLDGKVYWIILDKPSKLNSFDSETLQELRNRTLEGCRSIASLVAIRGEGRLFSAGIDLEEIANANTAGDVRRLFERFKEFLEAVVSCRGSIAGFDSWKPVVVVLNGPAVAGGAELALAADLVYAVKGSWLQWPELRWGLIPPMLAGLTAQNGSARLAQLGLAMERVGVEEARSLGIVSSVFEDLDSALEAVTRLAAQVESAGGQAVDAFLGPLRRDKMSWLERAKDLVALAEREEFIEEARAFLSKSKKQ